VFLSSIGQELVRSPLDQTRRSHYHDPFPQITPSQVGNEVLQSGRPVSLYVLSLCTSMSLSPILDKTRPGNHLCNLIKPLVSSAKALSHGFRSTSRYSLGAIERRSRHTGRSGNKNAPMGVITCLRDIRLPKIYRTRMR
jgi:hypothetical protein